LILFIKTTPISHYAIASSCAGTKQRFVFSPLIPLKGKTSKHHVC
jgi:hypothetical protein